ncbi:peroxide stress protein YaaA [Nocardioides acrostichi]|uniref:Peroxide stress protein YaaA n=1 Tax=Nocardioides acrostichi TaxID=2784339 RepID=A0A930UXS5_9ACTN|nr:peroxide stress protein YaaA [Nocardioides acrostichi]MBF4162838.1 peroxide stress protein YaaA [Nocardioides acrostichi]
MLILLPPSEGKATPSRGSALALDKLSSPWLTAARRQVIDALVELCAADPAAAAAALEIGSTQLDLVDLNARAHESPTARADRIYTGVLYDALDSGSLSPAARRRAATRVAITSSVFGLVRLTDKIPAYRLSGNSTLPGLGGVAAHWRAHLGPAVLDALGRGLLVDLRSTAYAAFWKPTPDLARRTATVRVLHEHQGQRKIVSHFNKATKGRLVRALLEDGANPGTPAALATALRDLGWHVESTPEKSGTRLDVVVGEL